MSVSLSSRLMDLLFLPPHVNHGAVGLDRREIAKDRDDSFQKPLPVRKPPPPLPPPNPPGNRPPPKSRGVRGLRNCCSRSMRSYTSGRTICRTWLGDHVNISGTNRAAIFLLLGSGSDNKSCRQLIASRPISSSQNAKSISMSEFIANGLISAPVFIVQIGTLDSQHMLNRFGVRQDGHQRLVGFMRKPPGEPSYCGYPNDMG